MTDDALPISQRPASNAPGHWVLARVGKRVLRPGGLELTLQMLSNARLTGARVVEFAPGLGRCGNRLGRGQCRRSRGRGDAHHAGRES